MMSITKKLVLVLGLVALLSASCIRTAFGDVSIESTTVSYTASRSISYDGPPDMIDFDVTVTLEFRTAYSCSIDGVLPSPSTCHLNSTPLSGSLALDYHIDRPDKRDLDGHRSIPLPQGGREVVGHSPPIDVPIDIGTITVEIDGHLRGYLSTDVGVVYPDSFMWTSWEGQNVTVYADDEIVRLTMLTTYSVVFTVLVSVDNFPMTGRNSNTYEIEGKPYHVFVIPEIPSSLVLTLFMMATLLAVIVYKRNILDNQ